MTVTINSIKDQFEDLVGEDIVVVVEAGRRKTKTHKGVLTETYPSVFVVELHDNGDDESYERVSYNYTDVLTSTIDVDFPELDVTIIETEEEE